MEYNELNHHGVKGQKWGVRRYQNPDGSLTEAGKKRIATKAGYYLNPEYGDKNSVNRRAVSKAYMNAYDELMRKHDIDTSGMDAAEAARKLEAKTGQKNLDDKLWNSFLDKYAEATLKDLGYENVAKAKEYVQELFRSDLIDLDELRHHGILGMKWGQRRFQNKDGSLTPAGKKRYSDDEPEESYEDKKARAIKSGSATEVMKFKGDYTPAEMDAISKRLRWENEIQAYSNEELAAKGKARVEKFKDRMTKFTDVATSAAKGYNVVANIFNALSTEHMLPKIDTNITSGNRNEFKAHKKEKQKADEANRKREEQEAQREEKHKERAEKRAKEAAQNAKTTVEGEGTSRYKRPKEGPIFDAEEGRDFWSVNSSSKNTSVSDVPYSTISTGKSRIEYLLEDKSK